MDSNEWQRVESILDKALSISNYKEREEFIRKAGANERIKKEVLELLRAIREAEEVGFMEEGF